MTAIKKHPEIEHLLFRDYVITEKGHSRVLRAGQTIKCSEITAQCINSLQPLTIRKVKAEAKE